MKFAYEVISIILWFHNSNSHLHSSAVPGNKEASPKSIRLRTLNVSVYDSREEMKQARTWYRGLAECVGTTCGQVYPEEQVCCNFVEFSVLN